jgi:AcrR family transcriptional regulator
MNQGVPDRKSANRIQKRVKQTHNLLMQAALNLFCDKGFDATTIEEITERADLGKGTFYRHFATKGEVMAALIQEAVKHLAGDIRREAGSAKSLQDLMEALLRVHGVFFVENRDEFVLLFQGRLYLKLQRDDTAGVEQPFSDYLAELQRQIARFSPAAADPRKTRRLACALAGFASGFSSFGMVGLSDQDIENCLAPLRRTFVAAASAFLAGAA